MDHPVLRPTAALAVAVALVCPPSPASAAKDKAPGFLEQTLDLPGIPAAVIPADMTGDGVDDLVVLVAYTTWDSVSKTEQVTFDDIEGLVEVMSVVSALLDRRELRVYPGIEGRGFGDYLPPLELDASVHALEASARPGLLIAVTDDGVAEVTLRENRLEMTPVLEVETTFAGSGAFYSELKLLHDFDDDGYQEIVLPTETGWSVHRGTGDGFADQPLALLDRPQPKEDDEDEDSDDDSDSDSDEDEDKEVASQSAEPAEDGQGKEIRVGVPEDDEQPQRPHIRIPEARDVNGDGLPDLLLLSGGRRIGPVVYRNRADGGFEAAVELELGEDSDRDEEITFVGDLDGDGRAELASQQEFEFDDEDSGFRKELRHAKRPLFTYRLYRLGSDLAVAESPYRLFEAIGYTFQGSDDHDEDIDVRLPGGFQDLDGDGRDDLVAITLDFSLVPLIFQALAFQRVSLRMDFHPWCQRDDGGFSEVPDLDLSGKFTIKFRNTQIKHLSQFAGDFNGDGRRDFIQLGRGKKVTIHQGTPHCSYPLKPDRKLRFEREPKHLGLVRILDLDGNDRSDIYVVHPMKDPKTGESIPVRVDLYLGED